MFKDKPAIRTYWHSWLGIPLMCGTPLGFIACGVYATAHVFALPFAIPIGLLGGLIVSYLILWLAGLIGQLLFDRRWRGFRTEAMTGHICIGLIALYLVAGVVWGIYRLAAG
jgi:hypothetical protein